MHITLFLKLLKLYTTCSELTVQVPYKCTCVLLISMISDHMILLFYGVQCFFELHVAELIMACLTFRGPCIVIILIIKANVMHYLSSLF